MGRSHLKPSLAMAVLLGGSMLASAASAQTIGYGSLGGSPGGSSGSGGGGSADAPAEGGGPSRAPRRGGQGRTSITPYIEAAQVYRAELAPGNDSVTYSQVAAGVEGTLVGRNAGASLSLRYERRFAWKKNDPDGDTISGLARAYARVAPGVQIDGGVLVARTRVEEGGASVLGPIGDGDNVTQVYSAYAGPSVQTRVGDAQIKGSYKFGYTRVESPKAFAAGPGDGRADVFDDSTVHSASFHTGVKPGDLLPVGVGVGAAYNREDISNLDQRVEDFSARGDVTLPVGTDVHLVAGVGYEDVTISSRDALRDAQGNPVIGKGGRYVTDKSGPRQIAYDTSGLIWDAGVVWRPSRRTALEAHVGRRYGSTSFYGSFAYAPSPRSAFNVSVYDNVTGFGGQLTRALSSLPTEFQAIRNPLTGDLSGCVGGLAQATGGDVGQAGAGGNGCLGQALGSVRSATFRGRGAMASYSLDLGSLSTGIGAGYDRRKFIAARNTVLGNANGVIDESIWLAAFLNGKIDSRSSFGTNVYANWFQSGSSQAGDLTAVGATASYNRLLTNRLTATAAVGIDGVNRDDPLEDFWSASALLGVRYSF